MDFERSGRQRRRRRAKREKRSFVATLLMMTA
jgi:hypothetical protein